MSAELDRLRRTHALIEEQEAAAGAALEKLSEDADRRCDYARYDEARFDYALASEDRLGELLSAVRVYLLTVRE